MLHLRVGLLYLGIALVITYPLVTVLNSHFAGHPFGDSYEYARHSWWIGHALRTGQPLFQHPLLAYPDGLSGAWLWAIPLQSFPTALFAMMMPLPLAFNLSLLLTLTLNGWSMFWLVRRLTGQPLAAWLAGLIFMAYPTFQGHLASGHIGLLSLYPLPFFMDGVLRVVGWGGDTTKSHGTMLRTAAWFVVSLWGSVLIGVYMLLPIITVLTGALLLRRDWRGLLRVCAVMLIGLVGSLPFLLPYLLESSTLPQQSPDATLLRYSADLLTIATPSFQNPLLGDLAVTQTLLGTEPFERAGYVGVVAVGLVLLALWRVRAARLWAALAVGAWILSLGPILQINGTPALFTSGDYVSHIPLPYVFLEKLPIIADTRTPARFNFAVGFAIALLAGYGAAWLFSRRFASHNKRFSILIAAVVTVTILFEYQLFWGLPINRGIVPAPIAALAERADVRVVFNIPALHPLTDKDAMWLQTGHQHPIIGGHIARETPVSPAKLTLLETLDPALLTNESIDVVILHKQWADAAGSLQARAERLLGAPFYEDALIAAYFVPKSQNP